MDTTSSKPSSSPSTSDCFALPRPGDILTREDGHFQLRVVRVCREGVEIASHKPLTSDPVGILEWDALLAVGWQIKPHS